MLSADSIRAQIAALLNGQVLLDDFEDWIVSSSWNVLEHVDVEVRQLVGAIELRLAERSAGHLDDADLLAEFQVLSLYGCAAQPVQGVFISVAEPSDIALVTLTSVADGPDYQFRLDKPQTSPMTRTGSARTVIRPAVALAS